MGYAHGEQWNEEKIVSGIMEVVNGLKIDRMPSRAETQHYFGNSKLTCAISRGIGWYGYSEKLSLPMKNSETGIGKEYEHNAKTLLESFGYEVKQMVQNHPFDLLVEGKIKIQVKVSHLYHGEQGNFYSFNFEKKYSACDIVILYTVSDSSEESIYVIPSINIMDKTQISIGEKTSIYHKFKNAWNYVSEYINFYSKLETN